ncbi:MAG: hypothetical protein WCC48_02015 [Anaeromyxobacteraceae bacterium]
MTPDVTRPVPRGDTYSHKRVVALASLLAFALTAASLALHGAHGRVYLEGTTTLAVRTPEEAFRRWREAGVRGRILLLFDRYPHLTTTYDQLRGGAPVTTGNFLEHAVLNNVVRKIILVVRDEEWEDLARRPETYLPYRSVPGTDRAFYLHEAGGLPLIAVASSALWQLGEPALVYVNAALFDRGEIPALLGRAGIPSDLTIIFDAEAPR